MKERAASPLEADPLVSTCASDSALIHASELTKIYERGREKLYALENISFQIRRGEWVAIVGPSGSGKTTLLNLLGCMDTPTSGTLQISGKAVEHFTEAERTRIRREELGFVFQHFSLLPTLTVAENVALPAFFAGRRTDCVDELLDKVGLNHRKNHRPHELSGGEMQRAAIARALINEPALLLADEPTGNLDSKSGEAIIDLFAALNREGLTLLVATHNPAVCAAAGRQLHLMDGRLAPRAT